MSIQAEFTNSEKISYLKPHIAIECFVGAPVLPPQSTSITTLIKQTIGENCNHPHFSVDCVSLDETAAEKWVALTRRIAGTQIKTRQSDKHLVRHLYDLYHLKRSDLLTGEYCNIVGEIVEKDRRQFKKHNITYTKDPLGTSELALDSLFKDNQWRAHWDSFLEQMVYDEHKPSFDDAYSSLEKLSIDIFGAIKQKA